MTLQIFFEMRSRLYQFKFCAGLLQRQTTKILYYNNYVVNCKKNYQQEWKIALWYTVQCWYLNELAILCRKCNIGYVNFYIVLSLMLAFHRQFSLADVTTRSNAKHCQVQSHRIQFYRGLFTSKKTALCLILGRLKIFSIMYNKTSGPAPQAGSLCQLEKQLLSGVYFENHLKHKDILW